MSIKSLPTKSSLPGPAGGWGSGEAVGRMMMVNVTDGRLQHPEPGATWISLTSLTDRDILDQSISQTAGLAFYQQIKLELSYIPSQLYWPSFVNSILT